MTDWQPIETCPPEVDRALLALDWGEVIIGRRLSTVWVEDGETCEGGAYNEITPTHWMPLPSPPQSEGTGA